MKSSRKKKINSCLCFDTSLIHSKVGELSEALFNEDTKIFFCCSTSGSANKKIVLPNKSPFLLFAYESILCQKASNWKQANTSFSSLAASSPGHSGGGVGKKGELTTTFPEFEIHL